jgi:Fe2+ or Zn2+ uptake regulation protein
MTAYTELAIEVLKDKGFRITKPRRLVLELLDGANVALSAYEIKDKLDRLGEKVDTVSVYRILETLEETHLIHRVLTTGKVKKCQLEREETCHLHQAEHCHHLLICERCEAVEEVHCPGVETLVAALEKLAQFKIHSHNMEFRGLCARCGP